MWSTGASVHRENQSKRKNYEIHYKFQVQSTTVLNSCQCFNLNYIHTFLLFLTVRNCFLYGRYPVDPAGITPAPGCGILTHHSRSIQHCRELWRNCHITVRL